MRGWFCHLSLHLHRTFGCIRGSIPKGLYDASFVFQRGLERERERRKFARRSSLRATFFWSRTTRGDNKNKKTRSNVTANFDAAEKVASGCFFFLRGLLNRREKKTDKLFEKTWQVLELLTEQEISHEAPKCKGEHTCRNYYLSKDRARQARSQQFWSASVDGRSYSFDFKQRVIEAIWHTNFLTANKSKRKKTILFCFCFLVRFCVGTFSALSKLAVQAHFLPTFFRSKKDLRHGSRQVFLSGLAFGVAQICFLVLLRGCWSSRPVVIFRRGWRLIFLF